MGSLAERGYDPSETPIPVAPAAHYTVGGIVTDLDGRTELPGLYAAGECAATGVHGANRLASNSLLECLVFGRRAALAALAEPGLSGHGPEFARGTGPGSDPGHVLGGQVDEEVRDALWRDCGLIRDATGLERLRTSSHLLTRLVAESALRREREPGLALPGGLPCGEFVAGRHVVLRLHHEPRLETWL